jgi:hypothetical protein
MYTWRLVWSPTGQHIGDVQAKTARAAVRKAPRPYSKYKGEIYAEKIGSNPGVAMARRVKLKRNPTTASDLPYGEWIPAHAVRFNDDGSTSLMTDSCRSQNRGRRRRNVFAGWTESETGIFHPIRASADYSRKRAGEKALKKKRKAPKRKAKAKARPKAKARKRR